MVMVKSIASFVSSIIFLHKDMVELSISVNYAQFRDQYIQYPFNCSITEKFMVLIMLLKLNRRL